MTPKRLASVRGAQGWIAVAAIAALVATACARQAAPAELDTANAACQYCRMAASDVHFAAQVAAPGAEALFFDDIGCLANFLGKNTASLPAGAVAFVADHRTGAWVRASAAVFTKPVRLSTPMGGGIIAHANEDSRQLDADATGGTPVSVAVIFGPAGPPNGGRR